MKKSIFPLVFALISVLLLSGCPALLDIMEDLIPTTTTTTIPATTTTTATTVPPTTTTTVPTTTTTTIMSFEDTLSAANEASGYGGSLPVNSGGRQYVIQNKIDNLTATQAITYYADTGNFSINQQTGSSTTSPVSFPSIFIGNNNGHATFGSGLPKLTSATLSIPTTWAWSNVNAPSAIFAPVYELWFTENLNNNSITAPEYLLAIWLTMPAGHSPIGSQVGTVVINGMLWNIWKDINTYATITYVAATQVQNVNFDLVPFINNAKVNGIILNTDSLHDVIAGFRIWSGGAGLASSNFSALVN